MDAGRRTMSALKTSEGGKSSRPDGCSTQCGAQCGALLYQHSSGRDDLPPSLVFDALIVLRPASFVRPGVALVRAAESSIDAELRSKG